MYVFRSIAAIIRFTFGSMIVALIGLVWLYHDGEISTSQMLRSHRRDIAIQILYSTTTVL